MTKQSKTKRLLALAALAAVALTAFAPMASAAPADTSCATKYPIVMVHGAGFRDMNLLVINYWGRIPDLFEARGAKVYYGNTDGWCSVEQGAADLKAAVNKVLAETGSAKVNIIAHSKGGLEARYMLSKLDMAEKVASLTTIATPHHGSKTMDSILTVPDFLLRAVGAVGNVVRYISSDKHPGFYEGVISLGTQYMADFNEKTPDAAGVYYQSFGAELYAPASDIIMCIPAFVIKNNDGPNDGMVTVESAKWTNFRGVLRGAGYRGISHVDEVDLRRADVAIEPLLGATTMREFYAAVVAELKTKGY